MWAVKQDRGLTVGRMAISIDFWDSTVHGKKHIMAMKAAECVSAIKFHQHVICS